MMIHWFPLSPRHTRWLTCAALSLAFVEGVSAQVLKTDPFTGQPMPAVVTAPYFAQSGVPQVVTAPYFAQSGVPQEWTYSDAVFRYPASQSESDQCWIDGPLISVPFSSRLQYTLPNIPNLPLWNAIPGDTIYLERIEPFDFKTADGDEVILNADGALLIKPGKLIKSIHVVLPAAPQTFECR